MSQPNKPEPKNSAKEKIHSDHAPAALGPYSQAVRIGDFVYTSGQVALDPVHGLIVDNDIENQTIRVFENLKAVLTAAGTSLDHVVKATVYLKSMDDFGTMNEVYADYMATEGIVPPARSTVEVSRLPKDARIEIDVIALIPKK
jgi:2-iminobutanoate/2-iminopropanoate deaminase